jgi:hypothetical protein
MKETNEQKEVKRNDSDKVHLKTISRESKAKKHAHNAGRSIARKWMENASNQEIIDALPRLNSHHDTNYFALMRNNYFISIEKIYPDETKRFKWFYNVDFMKGWREEVILLWDTNRKEIRYEC